MFKSAEISIGKFPHIRKAIVMSFPYPEWKHGTIIQTGITCKKIPFQKSISIQHGFQVERDSL